MAWNVSRSQARRTRLRPPRKKHLGFREWGNQETAPPVCGDTFLTVSASLTVRISIFTPPEL